MSITIVNALQHKGIDVEVWEINDENDEPFVQVAVFPKDRPEGAASAAFRLVDDKGFQVPLNSSIINALVNIFTDPEFQEALECSENM